MATRLDPLREFDRAFNNMFSQIASPTRGQAMPMDLYRDEGNFYLSIDLPGVHPASIDVDVEDRTLTIRAERKTQESDGIQWLTRERQTGQFARQLTLGTGLAMDRITAAYEDGVLTLTVPMAEEAKPRKIEVTHASRKAEIEQAG